MSCRCTALIVIATNRGVVKQDSDSWRKGLSDLSMDRLSMRFPDFPRTVGRVMLNTFANVGDLTLILSLCVRHPTLEERKNVIIWDHC